MIYLDTHVVVWLYAGETRRLSDPAREQIERNELCVSPVVLLELAYLRELGRITADSTLIVATLEQSIGLALCDLPFSRVVVESLEQRWTRDPFDRLIVAQAKARGASLITKDRVIRKHYAKAVW
jgi:PIN domain nuclease of toxin-antitoxin system